MANVGMGILGGLAGLVKALERINQQNRAEQLQLLQIGAQDPNYRLAPATAAQMRPAGLGQRLLGGTIYQPTPEGQPVIGFGGGALTLQPQPRFGMEQLEAMLGPSPAKADVPHATSDVTHVTPEGRQAITLPSGEFATERSTTVTDPRINRGLPTNIPTIFGGIPVDQELAIDIVASSGGTDPETGRRLPSYRTVEEATAAAQERSATLGQTLAAVPTVATVSRDDILRDPTIRILLGQPDSPQVRAAVAKRITDMRDDAQARLSEHTKRLETRQRDSLKFVQSLLRDRLRDKRLDERQRKQLEATERNVQRQINAAERRFQQREARMWQTLSPEQALAIQMRRAGESEETIFNKIGEMRARFRGETFIKTPDGTEVALNLSQAHRLENRQSKIIEGGEQLAESLYQVRTLQRHIAEHPESFGAGANFALTVKQAMQEGRRGVATLVGTTRAHLQADQIAPKSASDAEVQAALDRLTNPEATNTSIGQYLFDTLAVEEAIAANPGGRISDFDLVSARARIGGTVLGVETTVPKLQQLEKRFLRKYAALKRQASTLTGPSGDKVELPDVNTLTNEFRRIDEEVEGTPEQPAPSLQPAHPEQPPLSNDDLFTAPLRK